MRVLIPLLLLLVISMESCLLLYSPGYKSPMYVQADPPETKVRIDGKHAVKLPVSLRVRKKFSHDFEFACPGYLDEKITLRTDQNKDIGVLAVLSYICFFPIGIFDLFGSTYKFDLRKLEMEMTPIPASSPATIPIGFGDISFAVDSGKTVGMRYKLRGKKTERFKGRIAWQPRDTSTLVQVFIRSALESLSPYGYKILNPKQQRRNSRLPAEVEQKPKIILSASIPDVQWDRHTGRANEFEEVGFDVNWVVTNSFEQVLLLINTRASAMRYNTNMEGIMATAFRKAIFELVSLPQFQQLLLDYDETIVADSPADTIRKPIALMRVPEPAFAMEKDMLKEVQASVVSVVSSKGRAAGFFIGSNGLLLTKASAVGNGSGVEIGLSNGLKLPAELVRVSVANNLALLRVRATGLKPLCLSLKDELPNGEPVFGIGADLAKPADRGSVAGKTQVGSQSLIKANLRADAGSNGAPLLDKKGRVVGMIDTGLKAPTPGVILVMPIERVVKLLNLQFE